MDRRLDHGGGKLHVLEADVRRPGHVDQDAPRAVDGGLQQGAGDGHAGGGLGLVLAGGTAHAHVGEPRVLHDGGHIGEVQVDEPGLPDELGDGEHRLAQHVVGDLKGVGEGHLLLRGVLEPVVGDDDQGIHLAPQVLDALLRLHHPAAPLEGEGLRHHTHGQDALLLGGLGYDGGRAGAGAAAHAGGDEDHVRVLQGLGDLTAALLRALAAHLGVRPGPLAVGQLLPDLDLILRAGHVESLLVRVDHHKVNARDARADHAVDHVASAAAHADDLDPRHVIGRGYQFKCHSGILLPQFVSPVNAGPWTPQHHVSAILSIVCFFASQVNS